MKMCCPECQNYFKPKRTYFIAKRKCPFCDYEIRLYNYKIIRWVGTVVSLILVSLFWGIEYFTDYRLWQIPFVGIIIISWLYDKFIIIWIFNKFYSNKRP